MHILLCVAVCWCVLQRVAGFPEYFRGVTALVHKVYMSVHTCVVCCNVLQRVAMCYTVLEYVAVCCRVSLHFCTRCT